MPQTVVNLNGRLVPAKEAAVSPFDHGLLYGSGLFETVRVSQGKALLLSRHLARLERSAAALGFPLPGPVGALAEAIGETLRANRCSEARVRVTLTAGTGQGGPGSQTDAGPTFLVQVSPLPSPATETHEKGQKAIISIIRRSSRSPLSQHKTTNRLELTLASQEAARQGAEQAILLNEKRCVAECAAANIFFVAYGGLATPTLECGPLPGITRQVVIDLAMRLGIAIDERWISAEEIWDAEEAFVTSAIIGVMPLAAINGRSLGNGAPGPVTRSVMGAYRDFLREELAGP